MAPAQHALIDALVRAPLVMPRINVISNMTAQRNENPMFKMVVVFLVGSFRSLIIIIICRRHQRTGL